MKIGIYQSYWGRVGGGQRYIGLVAQMLADRYDVELIHHCEDFDQPGIENALELDLSNVGFRCLPRPERPQWPSSNPLARLRCERAWCSQISSPYDVYIDSSDSVPYFCHAGKGVLLTHFPLATFEEFHGHGSEAWRRRRTPMRALRRMFNRLEWRGRFASYDLFLVNSQFTRRWVKRRWGLQAGVLYPPLRGGFRPGSKEKLLLSIGAFHHARHKKHEILIESFRRLCESGVDDWRYVMVGARGTSTEDRAYVDRLRALGETLPIEIRTDIDGDELKTLLQHAAILWHSMGYGVDSDRQPQLMEHFGMVATEAMAAGCVPVVFNGGGLREIVTHDTDGMLWTTLDELQSHTRKLIVDPGLRARLGEAAVRRSSEFSDDMFRSCLFESLAPVLGAT